MRGQIGGALLAMSLLACMGPDEVQQLQKNQLHLLKRMERLEKKLAEVRPTKTAPRLMKGTIFEAFVPGRTCKGFDRPQLEFAGQPSSGLSDDPINDRTLRRAVELSQEHPREHPPLEIQVYTGARGSSAFNRKLSQQRAEAIRSAMVKLGADKARLVAKGYGESKPRIDPDGCDLSSRMVLSAR